MANLVIVKNNGFKLLNGSEVEFEGVSLKRFLEIITEESDVIDYHRNKQISIDDESLSLMEIDKITAALDNALLTEIFSNVTDENY